MGALSTSECWEGVPSPDGKQVPRGKTWCSPPCSSRILSLYPCHFLTSRTVIYRELRGMIFNYACMLHQYILNREPAQFEPVQILVNRSHWQSMKKKINKTRLNSSSGGHTGCSEVYNSNMYKENFYFTKHSII